MKKFTTQLALIACSMLLAGSASAQTDTTGRPIPDTVGRPVPDDTTSMPRKKKGSKKDRKMPKDTLNRATGNINPTAMLNTRWNKAFPAAYVLNSREFIAAKDTHPKKEETTVV